MKEMKHRTARTLAHCIYWPLTIVSTIATFACIVAIVVALCGLAFHFCCWAWTHWRDAALITAVLFGVAIIIAAYQWAETKLGKS